jgi:hypothetical protein
VFVGFGGREVKSLSTGDVRDVGVDESLVRAGSQGIGGSWPTWIRGLVVLLLSWLLSEIKGGE